MIERSYDPIVMTKAMAPYDYHMAPSNEEWLLKPDNLMYVSGEDVGLATFDYPGLYCVHWFFKSRGKKAIKTCIEMLDKVFGEHEAQAVRGVTPIDNKPARFLAKYVGCETVSIETYADGLEYELMILSKERFNQFKEKTLWPSV